MKGIDFWWCLIVENGVRESIEQSIVLTTPAQKPLEHRSTAWNILYESQLIFDADFKYFMRFSVSPLFF